MCVRGCCVRVCLLVYVCLCVCWFGFGVGVGLVWLGLVVGSLLVVCLCVSLC